MKRQFLVILIGAVFLGLFVLLNWNSFNAPFERDEGEYAYSAQLLRSGGTPYQDSFLQKPPLIVYAYAFGQVISPRAVWPPRAIAGLVVLLTALLVGLIAKKEWGNIAGIFSAFLFLPLIAFPPLTPFAANTEKFLILPLMGLLALFVYYCDSQKTWPYILAGVAGTCAIFFKPIALPVVAFIIIFWLVQRYRLVSRISPSPLSSIIKSVLWIGASALLSAIILLIPFFKVLPQFFQEAVIFNLSYASAFDNPLGNFANYLGKFWHYWWILLFFPLGLLFKRPPKIFFYGILLVLALLTVFSSPIGHYYLMLMPLVALLAGALLTAWLEFFQGNGKYLAGAGILIVALAIILAPFTEQFSMSPARLSEWVYGTVNPFGEAVEVAQHLAEVTAPNDNVFVGGSEPEIYYYADRTTATRFDITYPLNLPTPYREQFQTELVAALTKNPPKAMVVSQRAHSGLWNEGSPEIFIKYFQDLIAKNYQVVGGYVWTDSGGAWKTSLTPIEIQNSSLLLFKRVEGE